MDRLEVQELLAMIYANYQGQVKDAVGMVGLWEKAFQDCPAIIVTAAAIEHMRDQNAGRFLPKISDIEGRITPTKSIPGRVLLEGFTNNLLAYERITGKTPPELKKMRMTDNRKLRIEAVS